MDLRRTNLLPPALLLALSALFSRLLGVARDHLLARTFGATAGSGVYDLDVYYAAFRIPDLIYNLLVFGVVSAAFIPIFTRYKKEGDTQNAWMFASSMTHLMLLAVAGVSAVIYLFAPYLAHWVAGGFSDDQILLTVRLMRLMLISPILFSVTSVLLSLQDSFKTFFFRSLGPLFYNAGIIGGILFFGQEFGVVGVTWGVIGGAALQLIVQLPALKQISYRHFWVLGFRRSDVRQAAKLIVPRVLGLSFSQLTLMINTLIASFLATGSITVFYLADNLQNLPIGMVGVAFAITSFATLSELAGEPTRKPFADELRRVGGRILFLIIPATIGMIILRHEIVAVILRYGKFTQSDAALTSTVLLFLLVSLFAQSLIPLFGRGFYAFHNTKTPVVSGAVGSVFSVGGSVLLAVWLKWGVAGIAVAFSAGNILNFILLYIFMRRHLHRALVNWPTVFKMIGMSAVMGVAVFGTKFLIPFRGNTWEQIGLLLFYTAVGLAVYFGLARGMGINEELKIKN